MKRKISALLLSLLMLMSMAVSADVIWQNEQSRQIVKGIEHKYIEKFTDAGWQRINVLEVDLTNPRLSVTALYSKDGIKNLDTVSDMAKEAGAVAAVNADFFNFSPSSPLGFTVKDGEIISSPSHDPGLAVLAQDNEGNVFADYFSMQLFAVAPDGDRTQIIHINKYHSMQSVVMFTKGWGKTTPGTQNGAIELVAEKGIVTEIRENMPGAEIPADGFVLATSPEVNTFFKDNFVAGDPIEIELSITPDHKKINTAVGGGTVLVRDGKIYKFTNDVSGSHPRTAAGVSRDGDTLYLVAVDGRQTATPGMSQTQFAQLMIDLGAYNAINFDGGGSSTMVAQDNSGQTEVLNGLSGGAERSVSTALGILQSYPAGKLDGFDVVLSADRVFAGDSVEVWVTPYDSYGNPYTMNGEKIEYTSSGGGDFEKNVYTPQRAGQDNIMVISGKAKGNATLTVLDEAVQLDVYPQTLSLASGESAKVHINAKDKNGFEAAVSPQRVEWEKVSGNLTIKDGVITSADGGSAVVKLTTDKAQAYVLVNSFKTKKADVYDFSGEDAFAVYPDYVGGSYNKGVLAYDFTNKNTENTKAAYLVFDREISLENVSSLTLTADAQENMHWLRGQVDMPDGNTERITFAQKMDWTGQKKLTADIPEKLRSGVLSRIYIVQNDKTLCDNGSIELLKLEGEIIFQENSHYLKDNYTDGMEGRASKPDMAVLPAQLAENTMMDIHVNRQIKNSTADFSKSGAAVYTPEDAQSFSCKVQGENTVITLNNKGGGIRTAESSGWHSLLAAADKISTKNVFVFMSDDYVFNDLAEQKLFENTLTEKLFEKGKNVFVVYPSLSYGVSMKNGVRYMAYTKEPRVRAQSFAKDLKAAVCLCFKTKGGSVNYEYKPLTDWN
ncbi:MAG: phosphodiester glycosidase family protein [Clostridia bacterium]|nr:phosphodiester glycosidase family protein [Clostridia bacterium]